MLLICAVVPCFGGTDAAVDSLRADVRGLAESQREFKSSVDSISIKAIEKSQEFYKDSFAEIQNSYQIFIAMAGAILAGFAILTGFSLYRNSRLGINLKTQIENQKNEFGNMKDTFNDKIKELEIQKNRGFMRSHHFYQNSLDNDTVKILTELENEVGEKAAVPYLEEFYKRLDNSHYYDLWKKLKYEQKADWLRKIRNQVDSKWGEKLFADDEPQSN